MSFPTEDARSLAGSRMPADKTFCLPEDEENPSKMAEQKRLAYGQFKKIYEARGDTTGSLRYLANEMRARTARLESKASTYKQWFDY
ncbi:MAG: hypothetical protein IPJ82_03770 [Lewinellaceae bacterium]|nr:hypothetical protein [Lewinellaceae bacterium]